MTTTELETQIAEWRGYLLGRRGVTASDVDELEDHLRGRITDLAAGGLHDDESFLIAVKRMGRHDVLSREFAREHSDRLWKQLVLTPEPDTATGTGRRHDLAIMIGFAALAAFVVKLPDLFATDNHVLANFYLHNIGPLALAPLAGYFAWRRGVGRGTIALLAGLFALGFLAANVFPLDIESHTGLLTALHLPLAMWLVVGLAYAGGDWRGDRVRMDFIRFTGEWFIYLVLIGLGGGVLTALTGAVFDSVGVDASGFGGSWLVPCGGAAAVVVAAWLVEAKQSIIENMAPVLARIFTPLFAVAILALLVVILVTRHGIDMDRDVLILFNLLLVVVLGLLLYSMSARDPGAPAGLFDWMQLALVVSALLVDVLALVAMVVRTGDAAGLTANRAAALGENLVLVVNLAWSAWLYFGVARGRNRSFHRLERWQTGYLPVYGAWALVVVFAFPPLFDYV